MKPLNTKQEAALQQALAENHQLNPLRQTALKSQLFEKLTDAPVEQSSYWRQFSYKPVSVLATVAICVIVVGGAAFATETSIPGDVFHPIKLVAEQMEMKLAPSETIKATVEARHASERMHEAERLRVLSEKEKRAEIKAQIEERREKIEVQAKNDAEHVLDTLQSVRDDLESKGESKAIKAVDKTIEKLQNRAEQARIKIKVKTKDNEKIKAEEEKVEREEYIEKRKEKQEKIQTETSVEEEKD